MDAEEQTAVIAGVPQSAFADNVHYQFRTENNGGQVRSLCAAPAFISSLRLRKALLWSAQWGLISVACTWSSGLLVAVA